MIENIQQPTAIGIFYTNYTEWYGFSDREVYEFLMLLMIPTFFDILILKYEDHIEFIINVCKTDSLAVKIHSMTTFYNTIDLFSNVSYPTLENTYVVGENYDYLTAKYKLDAINK